jgi:hypothetical protein
MNLDVWALESLISQVWDDHGTNAKRLLIRTRSVIVNVLIVHGGEGRTSPSVIFSRALTDNSFYVNLASASNPG